MLTQCVLCAKQYKPQVKGGPYVCEECWKAIEEDKVFLECREDVIEKLITEANKNEK